MKRIFLTAPTLLLALTMSGCASMLFPSTWTAAARTSSSGGGIDPITQAANDDIARRTQEDTQRTSDWLTQQQNQATMDQANQMAVQASIDTANAAAASAAAAAASVPPVNP